MAEAGNMVDAASLLFMAGGALSYPIFLHLSLKKSLSIVSKEKVIEIESKGGMFYFVRRD